MFRKKSTDTDTPTSVEGAFRRPSTEPMKSAPPPEGLRRRVELPTGPGAPKPAVPAAGAETAVSPLPAQPEPDRYGKRLIVGEGIRLSGEISSCDRLVVEGEVEVTLNDTLALEITRGGRFTGGCEVEEADISGTYEGDLTVRKRLCVRSTGKLTGTIRYAQLELERGGQIAGNISVISQDKQDKNAGGATRPADRILPPFADSSPKDEASKAS
jgi:cytoskeletal protein CcmA (bactofilin family)